MKKINRYKGLRSILELTKNVKEINNVDEILKLIDDESMKEEDELYDLGLEDASTYNLEFDQKFAEMEDVMKKADMVQINLSDKI